MHRLTKMNLDESFNEYVVPQIRDYMKRLISVYNKALEEGQNYVFKTKKIEFFVKKEEIENETDIEKISLKDLYMIIISNCPQGLEKTMRVSTNYLQLKTMYLQRRNHKLKDWQVFCDEIEKLPYFKELTGCGK